MLKRGAVTRLSSASPTLESIRAHKRLLIYSRVYVPDSKDWGQALMGEIQAAIEGSLGISVTPRDDREEERAWHEIAESVVRGVLPQDPIFLNARENDVFHQGRSRKITVVPYGLVATLAAIGTAKVRRAIGGSATKWISVADAVRAGTVELASISGTCACDEANDVSRALGGSGITEMANEHLLARWLTEQAEGAGRSRVALVDSGIVDVVQAAAEPIGGSTIVTVSKQLQYRRPLLAGFPVPLGDIAFGEIVRLAVERVLYRGTFSLLSRRPKPAKGLENVGIVPLTPERWARLSSTVAVEVPRNLVPRPLIDGGSPSATPVLRAERKNGATTIAN